MVVAYDDGWESAMAAAGRGHVRRIAPSAAADANGHRSTAAARLIIRGRLGLDEGERGAWGLAKARPDDGDDGTVRDCAVNLGM